MWLKKSEECGIGKDKGTLIVTPKNGEPREFTLKGQYYQYIYRIVKQHQIDSINGLSEKCQGLVETKDFFNLYKTWTKSGTVRLTKKRIIDMFKRRGIEGILLNDKHQRVTRILAEKVTFPVED